MSKTSLDRTDICILSALQKSGRLSKSALAEKVNLSSSPCWVRLKRLEKAGFIKGYHTDIALEKVMEFTKVIVTVSLKNHRKQDFEIFESYIENLDEITQCVTTGGGIDYIITVICSSFSHFQNVMEKMVADEIGIDRYITYFVTREVKASYPNLSKLTA